MFLCKMDQKYRRGSISKWDWVFQTQYLAYNRQQGRWLLFLKSLEQFAGGSSPKGNAETHKLSSCNAGTLHITQLFPNIWQPGSVVALVGFSSLWTEELSFKSSFGQEAHLWNIKLFHLWRIHSGSVGPVPSEFHLVPHSHHRGTSRAENRAALLKGLRLNTTSIIQPLQGKLSCSTILPGAFGISTAKASGRGSLPVSHSWFYWLSLGANSLDTPS